jgi:hypothetical protein
MKICPVEAALFHACGQTDGWMDFTKPVVVFCSFVNGPKNDADFFTFLL